VACGAPLGFVLATRGPLAHRVEQGTFNPKVPGSSPGRPTVNDVLVPPGTEEGHDPARLSLWWAPLDISAASRQALTACVSDEERRRAHDYERADDGDRFLVARGWLRHLMGGQLHCDADAVRMETADNGKPMLTCSELRFNASRSADVALYATSWTMEVGIDIESIRSTIDVEGLAARFFTTEEQTALASLGPAPRLIAAFRCWTRKEAYVKGVGTGLTIPINTIDVGVDGDRGATVSDWTVHQVNVAPGFVAAVAGARYDGAVPNVQRIIAPDSGLPPAIIGP
jgi:4'-phosphopantetheinyl transferase